MTTSRLSIRSDYARTTTVDFPNPTSILTQLLGVNDSGEAAGYWQNAGGTQFPFTVTAGGIFTPLDSLLRANTMAQATDVNNAGEVPGFFVDGTGTHGFLLNGTTETTLNFPGSIFTQALGLNNMGEVVGDYVDGAGNMHGFIYNGTFQEVDDPSAPTTGTTINGINDKGQIVGFFLTGVTTPDGVMMTDGFVGTPVPKPGSLMLLGAALAGAALIVRKRRAH